jgi:hypothetical protein
MSGAGSMPSYTQPDLLEIRPDMTISIAGDTATVAPPMGCSAGVN